MSTWTKVAKPTGTTWTPVAKPTLATTNSYSGGEPIGLLLALTYSTVTTILTSEWTNVTKPTTASWTPISKPTS